METRFQKVRLGGARTQAGFTLIEVMVSLTISAMIMSFMMMVQVSGQKVAAQATRESVVSARLTRTMERSVSELQSIIEETIWEDLQPGEMTDSLTFQRVEGFQDGEPISSPVMRLGLVPEPSEEFDDIDNDGDGLIDEKQLVLTRDLGGPNEQRVTICRGVREYFVGETLDMMDENNNVLVDETGFHIERFEDRLTIRLVVVKTSPDGSREMRHAEATVRIRN